MLPTATMTATTATDPDRRRTSATVHAAATSLAWTSVIPEKRKVRGSTPPLTTKSCYFHSPLTCADTRRVRAGPRLGCDRGCPRSTAGSRPVSHVDRTTGITSLQIAAVRSAVYLASPQSIIAAGKSLAPQANPDGHHPVSRPSPLPGSGTRQRSPAPTSSRWGLRCSPVAGAGRQDWTGSVP